MARILVADDDESIRDILTRALTRAGHRVTPFDGGGELLRECREEPPDLVILDVAMPDADGRDVCRLLRARPETRGVRVVLLTGGADLALEGRMFSDACFLKPFIVRDLLAAVSGLVAA